MHSRLCCIIKTITMILLLLLLHRARSIPQAVAAAGQRGWKAAIPSPSRQALQQQRYVGRLAISRARLHHPRRRCCRNLVCRTTRRCTPCVASRHRSYHADVYAACGTCVAVHRRLYALSGLYCATLCSQHVKRARPTLRPCAKRMYTSVTYT